MFSVPSNVKMCFLYYTHPIILSRVLTGVTVFVHRPVDVMHYGLSVSELISLLHLIYMVAMKFSKNHRMASHLLVFRYILLNDLRHRWSYLHVSRHVQQRYQHLFFIRMMFSCTRVYKMFSTGVLLSKSTMSVFEAGL